LSKRYRVAKAESIPLYPTGEREQGEGENTPIPLLRRGGRRFPSKRGVIATAIGVW